MPELHPKAAAFITALKADDADALTALLKVTGVEGIRVSERQGIFNNPLTYAAQKNKPKCLEAALAAGIDAGSKGTVRCSAARPSRL
jgi:hypothetical protein